MSGRVARIVLCAAGPLENWLSPPCSAWWIHSSEKRSAESLCIASSAADFVPRAGCTPPGQHLLLHPHHPVPERVVRQQRAEVRQPAQNSRSFSSIVCSSTGKPAHHHEAAAGDELLVDLARRAVDVGMPDVLARRCRRAACRGPARGSPRAPAPSPATAGRRVPRRSRSRSRPTPSGRAPARCGWCVLMRVPPPGWLAAFDACAPAASVMKPASVPALTKRSPSPTNSVSSSRSRMPAIPKIVPWARHAFATVRTASRNVSSRNCPRMPISAVRSCGPIITMSSPGTDAISSAAATAAGVSSITDTTVCASKRVEQLLLRHRSVAVRRVGPGDRPVAPRREAARVDDRLRLGAGLDVRARSRPSHRRRGSG